MSATTITTITNSNTGTTINLKDFLSLQGYTLKDQELIKSLLGRMLFEHGVYDHWEIALVARGDENTCQSLVNSMVKLVGANTVLCEKPTDKLSPYFLQEILTGESSSTFKYAFFATQDFPASWTNVWSALQRRLFGFNLNVPCNMSIDIDRNEIEKSYLSMSQKYGSKDIWAVV